MKRWVLGGALLLFACGGDGGTTTDGGSDASSGVDAAKDVNVGETSTSDASPSDVQAVEAGDAAASAIQTVFVIMMENHDWADIKGNKSAPYINGLAALGAHAEQYGTPPGNHPSEPNYVWLESGDNLGITDDNPPSDNHQSTPDHLVSQLDAAGISWKVYAEGISGTDCPSADIASTQFAIRHVPPAFFDDQTTNATTCKQHVRPFTELATDLNGTPARYNFIVPSLCDDMHGETFGTTCNTYFADMVKLGDDWLKTNVQLIQTSNAYKNGGVIFIVWDEGSGLSASDGPLPFLVVSPLAKTGYASSKVFTHSDLFRTLETIFGLPYLRAAKTATDMSDFFTTFP